MSAGERKRPSRLKLRPGSGRYVLLIVFWIFLSGVVIHGLSQRRPGLVSVTILGPAVVGREFVKGWVDTLPYRSFSFEDRSLLSRVKASHPWIESLSEKKFPGTHREIRVRFWSPVALLRPSYGLMAFQVPSARAVPKKVIFLNDQGLSLAGDPYEGSGSLPQVIVRAPLTKTVGIRLVRTIHLVSRCRNHGAPAGQWFSLNAPHEIRFYPGGGSPVLILGTDLGCAPFRLYRSFMKNHPTFPEGKLPEGIDLRFSGMLILRPTLDGKADGMDKKEPGTLSGSY
jgi:hypothetical protein